ncbi:uncharacterized protein LOC144161789 [Haemaphysalis longicornis]
MHGLAPLRAFRTAAIQKNQTGGQPASSDLSTWPSYDWSRRTVHVPAALFNASVPTTGPVFALHSSRYSVRTYRALAHILFRSASDELDAALWRQDRGTALASLLACFEWDLRQLPKALRAAGIDDRGAVAPDSAASRGAVLQQTVALQMAFRAFKKLLRVDDFRYTKLPDLTPEQLFFIYYAIDNCESGDVVYEEQLGHRLPAPYRVNVPLRHVAEFGDAFHCSAGSPMGQMPQYALCSVVRQDVWHRGLESSLEDEDDDQW